MHAIHFWSIAKFVMPPFIILTFILIARVTATPWSTVRGRLQAAISGGQLLWMTMVVAAHGAYDAGVMIFDTSSDNLLATHILFPLQLLLVVISIVLIADIASMEHAHEEAVRQAHTNGRPLPVKNRCRLVIASTVLMLSAMGMSLMLTHVTRIS